MGTFRWFIFSIKTGSLHILLCRACAVAVDSEVVDRHPAKEGADGFRERELDGQLSPEDEVEGVEKVSDEESDQWKQDQRLAAKLVREGWKS